MNKTIKDKWLMALRSGDYKQAKGKLHRINGQDEHSFCCLGVLCDLHTNGVQWKPESETYQDEGTYHNYQTEANVLPYTFREDCGISPEDQSELIRMNDGGDYTFNEIADWIETNL